MNVLRRCTLIAYSIVILAAENASGDDLYVMDSSNTSVVFRVSHLGYSYTYGRFNQVKGSFVLDDENPEANQFQFMINANSIDTNNKQRDELFRGSQFLDVKKFDVIAFQSSSIRVKESEEGEIYTIKGQLTVRGVTRDITLPARKLGEGPGAKGEHRCGFFCETVLQASDFGITKEMPQYGNEIAVAVSFEGVKQEAPSE